MSSKIVSFFKKNLKQPKFQCDVVDITACWNISTHVKIIRK
nr:MAG TPA: hypothetical protein [Caudoviricetes sp.]